jgi:zinc protease
MNPLLVAAAITLHPAQGKEMNPLTQPPEVPAAKAFTPPTPTAFTLSNGVKVWLIHRPDLPLISLRMVLPGGSAADPSDAPGLTSFSDAMLLKGAGDRDASEFATTMEQHAIEIDIGTGVNGSWVGLDAHSGSLDLALELFADAVLRPRFSDDDIQRERDIRIGQLTEAADDARTVSSWVFNRLYFGADHALGHPVQGDKAAVANFEAVRLKASWRERYGKDRAHFVVAGDVDESTLRAGLEQHFADWSTANGETAKIVVAERKRNGPTLVFVDKPGTSQTSLRVGMPAPAYGAPDSEAAELGGVVLGGTFTSRLNRLLREEKGYTYGARAGVTSTEDYGILVANTNVQQDVSAAALVDLLEELKKYRDGIDQAELKKAKSSRQTRTIETISSRGGVVSALSGHALNDRPTDEIAVSLARAQAATVETVGAAIQGSSLNQALIVVVGDLAKIKGAIEEAVPGQWTVVGIHE